VVIKPSDMCTYENMVDALDEMTFCNIGSFAIVDLQDGDRMLLYKKTNNGYYLSEEQQKQGKK